MMHKDGTVHFSDLKRMALSPAHYRASVLKERETTAAMRMGSLVDMMLLTVIEPRVWQGDRRGNAWLAFEAKHQGEDIYTQKEYDRARVVEAVVRRDPIAIDYLGLEDPDRNTQVPLTWTTNGVPRSTRGLDVLSKGRLVDLKVTNSTHPSRFQHHARNQLWHAQLADYAEACTQNGIELPGGIYLVGVESTEPYCVTALHLSESALLEGRKCIASWIEQFKSCAATNEWPGYTQSAVELSFEEDDLDLIFPGDAEDVAAE